MKTLVHLWSHLAHILLDWQMFKKNVEKIKTRFSRSKIFLFCEENRAANEII